jgi:hypothetical protein
MAVVTFVQAADGDAVHGAGKGEIEARVEGGWDGAGAARAPRAPRAPPPRMAARAAARRAPRFLFSSARSKRAPLKPRNGPPVDAGAALVGLALGAAGAAAGVAWRALTRQRDDAKGKERGRRRGGGWRTRPTAAPPRPTTPTRPPLSSL